MMKFLEKCLFDHVVVLLISVFEYAAFGSQISYAGYGVFLCFEGVCFQDVFLFLEWV